jgi:hypothetical protein
MFTQAQVDAIVAALVANAAGPASASNDSGSVTARGLDEQIAAIKFMASMRGIANPKTRGLRMNALSPSGAVFGHGEIKQLDQVELLWMNRRFV